MPSGRHRSHDHVWRGRGRVLPPAARSTRHAGGARDGQAPAPAAAEPAPARAVISYPVTTWVSTAIWPGQQRHVLAGQQLGQHRAGDRIQRGHRHGQRATTVADCGPRSTQTPTSPVISRMVGQMRCRPANSSASACSGARGASKYSTRAWVGNPAGRFPPGEHDLVAVRAGLGVVQGDAGGGGPVEFPDRDEAGLPGSGRRVGLQAGLAGEPSGSGRTWLAPSERNLVLPLSARRPGPRMRASTLARHVLYGGRGPALAG